MLRQRLSARLKTKARKMDRKKANHNKYDWLYMNVNNSRFTNNVSWLGDPRLNKGHLLKSTIRANFEKQRFRADSTNYSAVSAKQHA